MTDKSYGDDVESHSYSNHHSHIPQKINSKRMKRRSEKEKKKPYTLPQQDT
jgi:hypothetical protein